MHGFESHLRQQKYNSIPRMWDICCFHVCVLMYLSLCAAKSVLLVSLVKEVLQSKVYAAKEVGYSYSLSPSPNGLTLSFSGLSDPAIFRKFIGTVAGGEYLESVPIDMGLDGQRNCQSCSAYTSSIRPFESVVGTLGFEFGFFSHSPA